MQYVSTLKVHSQHCTTADIGRSGRIASGASSGGPILKRSVGEGEWNVTAGWYVTAGAGTEE